MTYTEPVDNLQARTHDFFFTKQQAVVPILIFFHSKTATSHQNASVTVTLLLLNKTKQHAQPPRTQHSINSNTSICSPFYGVNSGISNGTRCMEEELLLRDRLHHTGGTIREVHVCDDYIRTLPLTGTNAFYVFTSNLKHNDKYRTP